MDRPVIPEQGNFPLRGLSAISGDIFICNNCIEGAATGIVHTQECLLQPRIICERICHAKVAILYYYTTYEERKKYTYNVIVHLLLYHHISYISYINIHKASNVDLGIVIIKESLHVCKDVARHKCLHYSLSTTVKPNTF